MNITVFNLADTLSIPTNRNNGPFDVWNDTAPTINGQPLNTMLDISIGEDWPERQNVLIVGNQHFSIPMQCEGRTKKLLCLTENRMIQLKPGICP